MSALAGIYHHGNNPVDPTEADRMAQTMYLHGVDGYARWQDGRIAMAQQIMLETNDYTAKAIPFTDKEAGLYLMLDGRLFNRDELQNSLLPLSGQQKTCGPSDGHLLLQSYLKWGEACTEHLVGEFAFALYDSRYKRLFLACDHMGIRPIFYSTTGNAFLFSSEIKGLIAHPSIETKLNHKKLARMVVPTANMLNKRETFYQGIFRLEGAHSITIDQGPERLRRYWRPRVQARLTMSDGDAFEYLREVAEISINERLNNALPTGSFLSGGLDSSTVTALAARELAQSGKILKTFSSVSADKWNAVVTDEKKYIEEFASWPSIEQFFVSDPSSGPFDNIDELVRATETPMVSSRHFLYRSLFHSAKAQGIRTLLDGAGGELSLTHHGAGVFPGWLIKARWFKLAYELKLRAQLLQTPAWKLCQKEVIWPLLPGGVTNQVKKLLSTTNRQPRETGFLVPQYIDKMLGKEPSDLRRELKRTQPNPANHHQHRIEAIEIARTLIIRLTGEFGPLSVSYPLLDIRLLEACLAAPENLNIYNGQNRYLVRGSMAGILPEKIRWRTDKEPFSPDFHKRFNHQRQSALDYLHQIPSSSGVRDIVDIPTLMRLASRDLNDARGSSKEGFLTMHYLPIGLYTIAFLQQFPELQ